MIAEIVTIGTELLLGEIVDSNAAHIGRQLAAIGVDHYHNSTVGDNEQRIVAALRIALARSDVVITTGGLGPTVDDVTRQAVAAAAERKLVLSPELLAQIEAYFHHRGYTMSESNRRQAQIPEGAIGVENPVGTAPSFIVEMDDKAIISLPGVPREMDYLMEERVLPYLSRRMGETAVILSRWVHTVAIGESAVGEAISDLMRRGNPTAGTRAHPGQTDVCITAKAGTRREALKMLDDMEAEVRKRLGKVIFGTDEETLAGVVGAELQRRSLRLSLADAITGGVVAARLRKAGFGGVLAEAHTAEDVRQLAGKLGLVLPGQTSPASALAGALRAAGKADLGLAVVEAGSDPPCVFAALATDGGQQQSDWPSRGRSDYATEWNLHQTLDLVRRWLLSTQDRAAATTAA